jgi:hypothetical protein
MIKNMRDRTKPELSSDDLEALERSAEDVRCGRFATNEDVKRVFGRYQQNEGRP